MNNGDDTNQTPASTPTPNPMGGTTPEPTEEGEEKPMEMPGQPGGMQTPPAQETPAEEEHGGDMNGGTTSGNPGQPA